MRRPRRIAGWYAVIVRDPFGVTVAPRAELVDLPPADSVEPRSR